MTLATFISPADFDLLVDAAYHPEAPTVTSSESAPGAALTHFADADAVKAQAAHCHAAGDVDHYAFGLWYRGAGGTVLERRIDFDPPRDGHRFGHSLAGWGLIHLHLYWTADTLQCRVVAHARAAAEKRQARYPELGAIDDWNWPQIESTTFRLQRRLASMGRTGPVIRRADVWQRPQRP
ncbi:hypothetical protein [Solimonas marina]|uniref:Uncharacterized protein n=1 Tax=Solimonas marina TaxID=2714601 RepID=A0A969W8B8_9GAMM|nr:hypothetical protein [Solimonas marina]NKF21348.1 hypothetical protein [Solimonas marina]